MARVGSDDIFLHVAMLQFPKSIFFGKIHIPRVPFQSMTMMKSAIVDVGREIWRRYSELQIFNQECIDVVTLLKFALDLTKIGMI